MWTRKDKLSLAAKLSGLIVVFLIAPAAWLEIIARGWAKARSSDQAAVLPLYTLALLLSFATILITPFIASRLLRLSLVVAGTLGLATDLLLRELTGSGLTIDMAQTLWVERAEASDAIAAYGSLALKYAPLLLAIAAVSALRPPAKLALKPYFVTLPVLAFAAALELMYLTRDAVIDELPSPVSAPAQFAMAVSSGVRYRGAREEVDYPQQPAPLFRKIVFIVDESIRGDYIGINAPRFDNTPFLNSVRSELANFGVATSATNCSRGTRIILRTGMREDQLPDAEERSLRKPSIWQYAKRAGYETVHLDGWGAASGLHSFMNDAERKAIDRTVLMPRVKTSEIDVLVAKSLNELLAGDTPRFIYVEKLGMHAPYDRQLPRGYDYAPAGLETLSHALSEEQRGKVELYLKGMRWRVDHFFEATFAALNRADTLVIYTSDHGQALYEGGYEASHCTQLKAVKGEGYVPLIAITANATLKASLQDSARTSFDKATHFEVFPTILMGMGYDETWIEPRYGKSLLSVPTNRKRRFLATQPLKSSAIWVEVDK